MITCRWPPFSWIQSSTLIQPLCITFFFVMSPLFYHVLNFKNKYGRQFTGDYFQSDNHDMRNTN